MALLTFLSGIVAWVFGGFVFMNLWNWFPHVMFDLPSISFIGAQGLILLISAANQKLTYNTNKRDELDDLVQIISFSVYMIVVLGVGAILRLIM